jgi:glycosyltransferase involved in cell wall biosynthesis
MLFNSGLPRSEWNRITLQVTTSSEERALVVAHSSNEVHVLHLGKFYPPHHGGMETHLHDLAVRQAQSNKISVIVANSVRRNELTVMEQVRVTRIARLTTIASMPVCPGLSRAIRHTPADLVHVHTPNPGAAQALLMSRHTGKVIVTHHADTTGRRVLRRITDPFVSRLMQRATRIIVTSSRYLESSAELAPFHDKCCVIPLGIDVAGIGSSDTRDVEELRAKYGSKMILAVGRLVPYKGFDVLIRAMKHVDAHLVLIGAGPSHLALERLAEDAGVAAKVTLLGRVADLWPYFSAATVFALPSVSRAEAFGMVQLEAMAAGLPVVNTNIDSGVPEVSVDGETGVTVNPGDVDGLASALRMLLDKVDLRQRMGAAARARVEAEYTADLMAERTWAIYQEVLGEERGHASHAHQTSG